MRVNFNTAAIALATFIATPALADPLAVEEPLPPLSQRNVHPAHLLIAGRNGELEVDEPLDANASQNIRPADYLVVDRAHDLLADDRPTWPRVASAAPGAARVRLSADLEVPGTASGRVDPVDAIAFDKAAVAMEVIEQGGAVARWFFTLQTAEGPTRFGELVPVGLTGEMDEQQPTVPLIGRVSGLTDAAMRIGNGNGPGNGWVYVASGPTSGEIWGVLDAVRGEPNPELTLVRSADDGRSWTLRPLRKPAPQAEFSAMAMDADGRGLIVLYLPQQQGELQPGFYPFATTDAGETWTAEPRRDNRPLLPSDERGGLRDALPPRQVSATWYGGLGWFHCYRPVERPYGRRPPRRPGTGREMTGAPEVRGRLRALENPGLDDRTERGKVPARFDVPRE